MRASALHRITSLIAICIGIVIANSSPRASWIDRAEAIGFKEIPCWFELPEGNEAVCGVVQADKDHLLPFNTDTVPLAVAIFKPLSPKGSEQDPIFYLNYEPGKSTIQSFVASLDRFSTLRTHREITVMDLGDAGYSKNESCSQGKDESCLQVRNVQYIHWDNVEQIAENVQAVRRALRYEQINILAVGRGSRIALAVSEKYPQGVRSLVLDSFENYDSIAKTSPASTLPGAEGQANPVFRFENPLGDGVAAARQLAAPLLRCNFKALPPNRHEVLWGSAFYTAWTGFRLAACEQWSFPLLKIGNGLSPKNETPALLLYGQLDPVSQPQMVDLAANTFQSAYLYEVPGAGNITIFHSACTAEIMRDFFRTPALEPSRLCILGFKQFFAPFDGNTAY